MKRYKQNEIDALAEILRNDGVISVPTDTVYGCIFSAMLLVYRDEIKLKMNLEGLTWEKHLMK